MSAAVRTIADIAAEPFRSVADAMHALSDIDDRGIWADGLLTPWSEATREISVRIAALRELMGSPEAASSSSPSSPPSSSSASTAATPAAPRHPHVGLLMSGTPEYLHLLGAAACSELVVAGLNPTRRGEALLRDAALADCAVILTDAGGETYLDKFAVLDDAQGEGLGRAVWNLMREETPQLFWRSRHNNQINIFYYAESDGCYKQDKWKVFWYGIEAFADIERCVAHCGAQRATLEEPST